MCPSERLWQKRLQHFRCLQKIGVLNVAIFCAFTVKMRKHSVDTHFGQVKAFFQFVKLTQVKTQSVHSRLYFEVYRRCFPTWNRLLQYVQRAETVHRESDIGRKRLAGVFGILRQQYQHVFCHLFDDKRFLNTANGKTIGNVRQHADGTQQAVSVGIVFDDGAQFAVSYPFFEKNCVFDNGVVVYVIQSFLRDCANFAFALRRLSKQFPPVN